MENEYEAKLNSILEYLHKNKLEFKDEEVFDEKYADSIIKELSLFDYNEFIELIEILFEDKYIYANIHHIGGAIFKELKTISEARITTKGRLFILSGGYVQLKEQKASQDDRLSSLEDAQKNSGESLVVLTRWLALGTVGLLVFEIVKFLFEHISCY